jgi:pectate lyase
MKSQMSWKVRFFAFLILALGFQNAVVAAVPAFPGAQGAGALSTGGRGGAVCPVTNLNDSGPGSFRDCVLKTGPRTVVFRVGGTIELASPIEIREPYLTIAGQTAPGGGIQISGKNVSGSPLILWSGAHHIVIRYLRIRKGLSNPPNPGVPQAISIGQNVSNIIIDHVSLMWAHDDAFGVWTWGSSPNNITLQNSIVAETLQGNATAAIMGGDTASDKAKVMDVDLHRNLFFSNTHRIPSFAGRRGRFVNNLIYNFNWGATFIGTGAYYDVIGNHYKDGPINTTGGGDWVVASYRYQEGLCTQDKGIPEDPSIYITGNKRTGTLPNRHPDPEVDNWVLVRDKGANCSWGAAVGPLSSDVRRYTALAPVGIPITVQHVNTLEDSILPHVGASQRLDCRGNWITVRDSQDARVVEWYRTNQGFIVGDENQVGGFPVLASGPACQDTSGDGIPDEWAVANGLDHRDGSLGARIHESGYSFLELYLNGMSVLADTAPPARVEGVTIR